MVHGCSAFRGLMLRFPLSSPTERSLHGPTRRKREEEGEQVTRSGILWLVMVAPALAGQPREGVVVQIADGEVVFDLGRADGLNAGGTVRFFRRLTVKHPLTGKEVVDRFPIGLVRPTEVGEHLSIAREVAELSRPPRVGDYVVVGAASSAAPVASRSSVALEASVDMEWLAIKQVITDTFGHGLEVRVARWEKVLAAYPEGRYAGAIQAEVASLRDVLSKASAPRVVAPVEPRPAKPPALMSSYDPPRAVVFGRPVELAVAIGAPQAVDQMRLLVRRRGDPVYATTLMDRSGDATWRAHLPEAALTAPGTVDYVIEGVRPNGDAEAVVGTTRRPEALQVTQLPPGRQPPGHSEATASFERVDFDSNGVEDSYIQAESTFAYDLEFMALRRVRVGVGVIDGEALVSEDGRSYLDGVPDDDEPGEVRSITLNYAFAEAEVDAGEWAGVAGRVVGGNHHSTRDDTSRGVTGFEGRVRVGRGDETRLVFGAGVLGDIGDRFFADMHIAVFERFPIEAGASVTNLPLNADDGYGLRLRTKAGWQVTELLAVNAVLGWNARNINHYGATVGGGLTLGW